MWLSPPEEPLICSRAPFNRKSCLLNWPCEQAACWRTHLFCCCFPPPARVSVVSKEGRISNPTESQLRVGLWILVDLAGPTHPRFRCQAKLSGPDLFTYFCVQGQSGATALLVLLLLLCGQVSDFQLLLWVLQKTLNHQLEQLQNNNSSGWACLWTHDHPSNL